MNGQVTYHTFEDRVALMDILESVKEDFFDMFGRNTLFLNAYHWNLCLALWRRRSKISKELAISWRFIDENQTTALIGENYARQIIDELVKMGFLKETSEKRGQKFITPSNLLIDNMDDMWDKARNRIESELRSSVGHEGSEDEPRKKAI